MFMEMYMELNQDINVLHVVNWLKLAFPGKYCIKVRDETYYITIDQGTECGDLVGWLDKELNTVYLNIPKPFFWLAVNSIIMDLKVGFNLSERYTKIRYGEETMYMYKVTFKE